MKANNMDRYTYRGKRVDNGKWVYGAIYGDSILITHHWNKGIDGSDINLEFNAYEVDSNTIGQSIGICDKDGVEAFEGDIVSDRTGNKYIVKWLCKYAKFILYAPDNEPYSNFSINYIKNMEITGNIHDN